MKLVGSVQFIMKKFLLLIILFMPAERLGMQLDKDFLLAKIESLAFQVRGLGSKGVGFETINELSDTVGTVSENIRILKISLPLEGCHEKLICIFPVMHINPLI